MSKISPKEAMFRARRERKAAAVRQAAPRPAPVVSKPVPKPVLEPVPKDVPESVPDLPEPDAGCLRILYVSSQRPGYGGASTETYEMIKALRKLGHSVRGLFLVHPEEAGLCDPDRIGEIWTTRYRQATESDVLRSSYDVAIGKNYQAAIVVGSMSIPSVYLTSGIDFVSRYGQEALSVDSAIPEDGSDAQAIRATDRTLIHSTLDRALRRKLLPRSLLCKIDPRVIYTPDVAVAETSPARDIPLSERLYDVCFSASNWDRPMKNRGVAEALCRILREDLRIVVFGEAFDEDGVICPGLVSHAQMIHAMRNSRVVVIPSLYDPSPNLYAEAVACGCNVVVNPNVGNIDGHPKSLMAEECSAAALLLPIRRAVAADTQLGYRRVSREDAAVDLSNRLLECYQQPKASVSLAGGQPNVLRGRDPATYIKTIVGCAGTFADGVYDFGCHGDVTDNFSVQWDRYRHTQIDSLGYESGYPWYANSAECFWTKTGLRPSDLAGCVVLDAGCGAGRFSDVVARQASGVVAVDLSRSVYRAAEVLQRHGTPHAVVRADLQDLPFGANAFDVSFSIGVLHHCESPEKALAELVRVTRPGGIVCGWVYSKRPGYDTEAYRKLRAFTSDPRNREWVSHFSELAPILRDLAAGIKTSTTGRLVRHVLGISISTNDVECMLDTFDQLTPIHQYQYDQDEWDAILRCCGLVGIRFFDAFPVSWQAYVKQEDP